MGLTREDEQKLGMLVEPEVLMPVGWYGRFQDGATFPRRC